MSTQKTPRRAPKMSPEGRRTLLLNTGVEVFAALGIDGAKHKDLSQAADVAVPTVFKYFSTREALVTDILAEVQRVLTEQVLQPMAQMDVHERMLQGGYLLLQFAQQWPNHAKVWLMWSVHSAPAIQAQYAAFELGILEALGELIEANASSQLSTITVRDGARILTGAAMILARETLRGTQQSELERFLHSVTELVTR